MKYLAGIGILVLGVGIGYIIGSYKPVQEVFDENAPAEYITETVHDTVVKTKEVRVKPMADREIDSSLFMFDTDTVLQETDTLVVETEEDTTAEDISIRTEKMIDQKWLKVNVIEEIDDKDSLLHEMMGIENKMPSKVLVEFWESPLHFTGYKLSKSKLILYGLPPGPNYKLFRKKTSYFLSVQSFYYSLQETEEFLPYLEVSKEVVFND